MTRGRSLGPWVAALLMTAILAAATLLPLSSSPRWWVRAGDFPRVQIALGLPATLLLIAALPGRLRVVLAIGVGPVSPFRCSESCLSRRSSGSS